MSSKAVMQYGRRKNSTKSVVPETPSISNLEEPIEADATVAPRKRRRVDNDAERELATRKTGESSGLARPLTKRKPIASEPGSRYNLFDSPSPAVRSISDASGSPPPAPPPITPKKAQLTSAQSRSKSFDRLLAHELGKAELPSTPRSGRAKGMKKRVVTPSERKELEDSGTAERSISPSPSPIRSSASSPLKPSTTLTSFDLPDATSRSTNSSPTKSQRGFAKRMLSKSKTEPVISVAENPFVQGVSLTASQSLPLVRGKSEVFSQPLPTIQDEPEASTSNSPQRPQAVIHKKTYAASRSFLVPVKIGADGEPVVKDDDQDELEEELRKESYFELQERWGVDASNELEDSVLKSITEMRSKGENRRFRDEMGYLTEGLEEGNALAVQQGSAIEIIGKMSDLEFMRRAKAADFVQKTWDMVMTARGQIDNIFDPALALFAALIARDPHLLQEMTSSNSSLVEFLLQAAEMSEEQDKLANTSGTGLTKSERRLIEQLQRIIKKTEIVQHPSRLSTPLLATRALRVLRIPPPEQHSAKERISNSLIVHVLRSNTLVQEDMDVLEDNFDAYLGDLECLHNYIATLESISTNRGSAFEQMLLDEAEGERNEQIVRGLLYVACGDCVLREDGEERDIFSTSTTLRAILNATNQSPSLCEALSRTTSLQVVLQLLQWSYKEYLAEDIGAGFDADARSKALDRFCLALGILTNVVRGEESSKNALRGLGVSPDCTPSKECIRKTTCTKTIGAIAFLVTLYSNHYNKAKEQPTIEDTFLTGHLAVLLGILADSNTANQRVLLKALPGKTKPSKLDDLIRTVEDFAASYSAVVAQLSRLEVSGNDGRMENRAAGDEEQNVAHEVAASLRALRDE